MAIKNYNIVHALQDACKEKDVYKFLHSALMYYTMTGKIPPADFIELLGDVLSDEEKEKIMYTETINIQNALTVKQ